MRLHVALAVVLLGLQSAFWYQTYLILPKMEVVPNVPGEETVKALSLGDEQFFFRLLGLQLQNAGDTYGRFTALYKYDFNKLYHWFRLLDKLNPTSNFIPSMATYYFAQTQNKPDVRYVIDYLVEHSEGRLKEKWWWRVQAAYLASHKLENKALALRIAEPLSAVEGIPLWARQTPAFLHEQRGEMDEALHIIDSILSNTDDIKQGELNFMRYFVEERLGKLEEMQHHKERLTPKPVVPGE
jgi:hypothetical protein